MTIHNETTYIFYLPQDYDEMRQFEAENDLSRAKKTEDTIATRYKLVTDCSLSLKGDKE